jgi:hypothetical protein
MPSTLLEKMFPALLRDSGVLNPSFLAGPVENPPRCTGSVLFPNASCLSSIVELNVLPLSVRSTVRGCTPPDAVLATGSTTATRLVTGSMKRLLTTTLLCMMKPWFTNTGLVTTTVVKLWQMKKPGNQKPNQNVGKGTHA